MLNIETVYTKKNYVDWDQCQLISIEQIGWWHLKTCSKAWIIWEKDRSEVEYKNENSRKMQYD